MSRTASAPSWARAESRVPRAVGNTSGTSAAWRRSGPRWSRARIAATLIHPIVGARRVEQLTDNLHAGDLELTVETLARLDKVSALQPEFPYDMIDTTRGFIYGAVDDLVEHG